jgi:cell division protein FtsB
VLEKTKNYHQKIMPYLGQLRDVRVVGLLFFLMILVLITWSGVKTIETNYGLQREISKLQQQTSVQQLSNDNLRLSNAYYNTSTYLELAARQDFGMAAKGETVWAVPRQAALARTVELPGEAKQQAQEINAKQPTYQRNFQAWMDFFMHRQR